MLFDPLTVLLLLKRLLATRVVLLSPEFPLGGIAADFATMFRMELFASRPLSILLRIGATAVIARRDLL